MPDTDFKNFYKEKLTTFETYLHRSFPPVPEPVSQLAAAMQYSLYAGGKRIRPVLLLTTLECGGTDGAKGLPFAAAIEYIHTYSLIHDDLPCMDNDDLRRGQPTNHVQFGEALALLAGDALLTHSFALISDSEHLKEVSPTTALKAIRILSHAAGVFGMVSGQVSDISEPPYSNEQQSLDFIHGHKTGALITAAVHIGALLAELDESVIENLIAFGREIGKCFQIQDDILDVTGDTAKLGKAPGRDVKNETLTFPRAFGLKTSQSMALLSYQEAMTALQKTGLETTRLQQLADYIIKRDR